MVNINSLVGMFYQNFLYQIFRLNSTIMSNLVTMLQSTVAIKMKNIQIKIIPIFSVVNFFKALLFL
jgi:hypothetical protein